MAEKISDKTVTLIQLNDGSYTTEVVFHPVSLMDVVGYFGKGFAGAGLQMIRSFADLANPDSWNELDNIDENDAGHGDRNGNGHNGNGHK